MFFLQMTPPVSSHSSRLRDMRCMDGSYQTFVSTLSPGSDLTAAGTNTLYQINVKGCLPKQSGITHDTIATNGNKKRR